MVSVPQYNQQGVDKTPLEYSRVTPNADAFGAAVFQAKQNLSNSIAKINFDVQRVKEEIDTTRAMEYRNFIEKTKMKYLNDPENGYFSKLGKRAMADPNDPDSGANGVVNAITRELETKQQELGLTSGKGKQYADYFTASQLNGIILATGKHEKEQRLKWQEAVTQESIDVSTQEMINNALTNPEEIDKQISNINAAVLFYGQQVGYDEETLRASQKKEVSKSLYLTIETLAKKGEIGAEALFEKYKDQLAPEYIAQLEPTIKETRYKYFETVLNSFLAEDEFTQAKSFLNEHKDDFKPERVVIYKEAIKDKELKYNSRILADSIIGKAKNEQEAFEMVKSIKDSDLADMATTRIAKHYGRQTHIEDLEKRELLKSFYDTALYKIQNDEPITIDDIPEGLDSETKLSLMNYINKNGQPEDDNQIWQELYNMSVNNAQGFAALDLNQYRGFLSESEFKQFLKRQEDIKTGNYYSEIKDDDAMIQAALKEMGLNGNVSWFGKTGRNRDIAYSEIRAMVREFEARKGRKITDDELQNLLYSLDYKEANGVKIYKLLDQGMATKTGFIKGVINDFVYYQNKHNGQLPPDEEKYRIIAKRMGLLKEQQRTEADNIIDELTYGSKFIKDISDVQAQPNEQKTLTYFADTQVPAISKQLGLNLKVTDRYRAPNGKYKSHHSEGRALDISYRTKEGKALTLMQKIKLVESVLYRPEVETIAISSADSDGRAIINYIKKNYGNAFDKKIQDMNKKDKNGKTRDQNLGTNHTSHIHITLMSDDKMLQKTQIAQNGVYKF